MTDSTPPIPEMLYKYLSPARVDAVASRLLRYTQLGAFNDPFDGRPHITALGTETELKNALTRILPEESRRAYDVLPEQIKTQITFESFSALAALVAEYGSPNYMDTMRDLTPAFQEWWELKADEFVGALSLSELPNNILMWSHYSNGHTGFVLCFDASHTYFNGKLTEVDELRHVRRVVYRKERTQAPMTELNGLEMFFVKSDHWAYEKEWRILRPLEDAEVTMDEKPFPIHLFRFPDDALRQIIFGSKMDQAVKRKLVDAVAAQPSLKHVTFKQAVLERQQYAVEIGDFIP